MTAISRLNHDTRVDSLLHFKSTEIIVQKKPWDPRHFNKLLQHTQN